MLRLLKPGIPDNIMVIVLSDRALYATWLFRRIKRPGWHPFMRKSVVGTFRPDCGHDFHPISSFAKNPGTNWSSHGTLFKTKDRQLKCTLLAYRDATSKEPWFIITDFPPEIADACWYGMRACKALSSSRVAVGSGIIHVWETPFEQDASGWQYL
jgi:hypothetical protein